MLWVINGLIYVFFTAVLLTFPLFTMDLNRYYRVADSVSVEIGIVMIFFL